MPVKDGVWNVSASYLCSWFHFYEIHLYTSICKIPGYCYTQRSHHSCVFHQYIRRYLNQQKIFYYCIVTNLFVLWQGIIIQRGNLKCYNKLPVQLVPFPWNPSSHMHLWDPKILLHTAFTSQSGVLSAHSFISITQRRTSYRWNPFLKPSRTKKVEYRVWLCWTLWPTPSPVRKLILVWLVVWLFYR